MNPIISVEPPDTDDCPTCGNCGEDFNSTRFYDNNAFQFICAKCADYRVWVANGCPTPSDTLEAREEPHDPK